MTIIKMTEDMMTELLIQKDEYEVSFGKNFTGINEEFINHILETKYLMCLQPEQMDLLMNTLQSMNQQELENLTHELKIFQDKTEKEIDDEEDSFMYEYLNALTLYKMSGYEPVGRTPHFLKWIESNAPHVKSFSLTIFEFLATTTKFERFLTYFTEWSKEKGKIGDKKYAEMIASDLKKIKAAHTKNKRGFGN